MLRTFVSATIGRLIDFDRAFLLMDADLVDATFVAMMNLPRGAALPDDTPHGAHWIWDEYCERHRQKHGRGF